MQIFFGECWNGYETLFEFFFFYSSSFDEMLDAKNFKFMLPEKPFKMFFFRILSLFSDLSHAVVFPFYLTIKTRASVMHKLRNIIYHTSGIIKINAKTPRNEQHLYKQFPKNYRDWIERESESSLFFCRCISMILFIRCYHYYHILYQM